MDWLNSIVWIAAGSEAANNAPMTAQFAGDDGAVGYAHRQQSR
jgi:hypothetical protein